MKQIAGERVLRGTRKVLNIGGSKGVTLHLDTELMVGDRVQQSILPDGSIRIKKIRFASTPGKMKP